MLIKRILKLKQYILVVGILFCAFVVAREALLVKKSQDLNIVLISIDALRPDHMSAYGYSKDTTPNIKAWGKNAFVFTNTTTMVPMTIGSFSILMTGRTPFDSRIADNFSPPPTLFNKTLATRLSEYGYDTAAFVTNAGSLSQGFKEFKTHLFKYPVSVYNSERYEENSKSNYLSFIQSSLNWIKNHKNRKFFTWIHLMDTHTPYFPSSDLRCKFNPKYCSQINNKSLDDLDSLRAEYQLCQQGDVPKERIELMETLYDGEVASADRIVGKILQTLKNEGLNKNTIVILYGDHGEGFDHNYYFNHREVLYNSAVKIPLIIKHPLFANGKKINTQIQNLDILPTILDLVRIPIEPANLSGTSFANIFSRFPLNLIPARSSVFKYYVNSDWTKFAVSDGRHKYIYSLPRACLNNNKVEELYDLKNDVDEVDNIVNKNSSMLDNLRKNLFNYLSVYNLPQMSRASTVDSSYIPQNKVNQKVDDDLRSIQY
ncbi:MAG: hypothetical protein COX79_00570 [Candidatus Levybacteria bacterium CG_4_10_14_0_2_um_filter_36_16]|nr:MAG: hypothetical protein AUK12_03565 [Candidatus Levybacteria bacterium CG2_30_37_29]PIR79412.1 MAG: hypothetical protein COU26_01330 [Candidatus Levybacteria bacterium CG10_big_fil_rev_8_21_14_0_10_36_30]PIZ97903.1 MAG: hypothetical protein COX79_00570 [Candidatus Levybacteria bacterium CG_4_10_14_0_2_um_filter_36_16]